jgi:hypothetical protein
MPVSKASDVKVPARTRTPRANAPAANGAKPAGAKPAANGKPAAPATPATPAVPENNASGRANGTAASEIERLKAEIAALRTAEKAAKAAKKSAHEEGYRGALTKPVEGKVAEFCAWVEKKFPELGELSDRDRRFVLITLRAYGAFQAEVNGRTVA